MVKKVVKAKKAVKAKKTVKAKKAVTAKKTVKAKKAVPAKKAVMARKAEKVTTATKPEVKAKAEIVGKRAESALADFATKFEQLSEWQVSIFSGVGIIVLMILIGLVGASDPRQAIERRGEGQLFYTTIKIPAGAETLYLSGSGSSDGSMGGMEEQTRNTFANFRATLEEQGWSMSDIVQVRAFAVAGEGGQLDFDGFNRAYREFFGTEENPMKPVRSFVQVEALVVPGWLVEVEIRAARMPGG
ncbi:MAG TPA: hypothetical protein DCM64_06430 [Gammaproteobacteria bacterium]|jgi:enamine deaminase RidA (YjgF/YER057c/UK114 family)|nr:Rid family hydrolase [Gammaproteobacteria bacterium]MDP6733022.1 Rid family hydrolase [Gammaproteobacteria bacterium]HAJ76076.1 hypothetical protein [Gammaproteobacteria bacterium]|tara:strand:+ start:17729 stop:18460 length:732 start_codon:yes stop_codon:yes gene_type:complete